MEVRKQRGEGVRARIAAAAARLATLVLAMGALLSVLAWIGRSSQLLGPGRDEEIASIARTLMPAAPAMRKVDPQDLADVLAVDIANLEAMGRRGDIVLLLSDVQQLHACRVRFFETSLGAGPVWKAEQKRMPALVEQARLAHVDFDALGHAVADVTGSGLQVQLPTGELKDVHLLGVVVGVNC